MAEKQNASDAASAKQLSKNALLETVALVLLSLGTVGTAWCSYQAATWSAVSQRTMNLSAAASRRSVSSELYAHQNATVDVLLFSQYMNARTSSNEVLSQFYSDRFRKEARTAFNAWLATKPFENTNAPPHPFVTNFYQPQLRVEARREQSESDRLWQQAGEAGRTGRSYVLVTVLLASALFCGGTASKFEKGWMHRAVLWLGLLAFVFAAVRLAMLPIKL